MNRRVLCASLLLVSGLLAPFALMAAAPEQGDAASKPVPRRAQASGQGDEGARVFAANCSRCHQAPMGLAPRITGTVIMHMRTRARLSREDEKKLLKYLAP